MRFTNDGTRQQFVKVGRISITALDEDEQIFSYTLFGESGSEQMMPTDGQAAPMTRHMIRGLLSGTWP